MTGFKIDTSRVNVGSQSICSVYPLTNSFAIYPDVFVELDGHRFAARVEKVFILPNVRRAMLQRLNNSTLDESADDLSDSDMSAAENDTGLPLHIIGGDMGVPLSESLLQDNPRHYTYRLEILKEEESEPEVVSPSGTRRESDRVKAQRENGITSPIDVDETNDWAGKRVNVGVDSISYVAWIYPIAQNLTTNRRDRLVFSKSLLRRFLRECLDRESSLASPWIVKPALARRYNIPTEMPESIKAENDKVRKDEIDKRKKVWEEKEAQAEREGRLTKKMIKEREREAKGELSVSI